MLPPCRPRGSVSGQLNRIKHALDVNMSDWCTRAALLMRCKLRNAKAVVYGDLSKSGLDTAPHI